MHFPPSNNIVIAGIVSIVEDFSDLFEWRALRSPHCITAFMQSRRSETSSSSEDETSTDEGASPPRGSATKRAKQVISAMTMRFIATIPMAPI